MMMADVVSDRKFFGQEFRNRVIICYTNLRLGMGIIAFIYPLLLSIGGYYLTDTQVQESLSAYYFTAMRNAFVGGLFAIGPFLYLYKGFSTREDYALNAAGIFVIGVAIFPMELPAGVPYTFTCPTLHYTCAILFFACIAYVCIQRSGDTLQYIKSDTDRLIYRRVYYILGILMIILPLLAALLIYFIQFFINAKRDFVILGLEWAGVWVFSAYWLIKSWEINQSGIEYAGE